MLRSWPNHYYAASHPRLAQKRPRSESRGRRPNAKPQRASSLPPRRIFHLPDDHCRSDFTIKSSTTTRHIPGVVCAGNLFLDVVESEDGMTFLRVRPSSTSSEHSNEMFLFSGCPKEGFMHVLAYPSVGEAAKINLDRRLSRQAPRNNPSGTLRSLINADDDDDDCGGDEGNKGPTDMVSTTSPHVVLMDKRAWDIRYRTGWLSKCLLSDNDKIGGVGGSNCSENSSAIRFQIQQLAWKLLTRDFAAVSSLTPSPSPSPLKSVPLARPTSPAYVEGFVGASPQLTRLLEAAETINNLVGSPAPREKEEQSVVLARLTGAFEVVASVFLEGEEAVTPYELSASGIVSALLKCLVVSKASEWCAVVSSYPISLCSTIPIPVPCAIRL